MALHACTVFWHSLRMVSCRGIRRGNVSSCNPAALIRAQTEGPKVVSRCRLCRSGHGSSCTFKGLLRQSFLNVRSQLEACILAINRDVLDVQAIGMEPCQAIRTLHLHALQPQMTLKQS